MLTAFQIPPSRGLRWGSIAGRSQKPCVPNGTGGGHYFSACSMRECDLSAGVLLVSRPVPIVGSAALKYCTFRTETGSPSKAPNPKPVLAGRGAGALVWPAGFGQASSARAGSPGLFQERQFQPPHTFCAILGSGLRLVNATEHNLLDSWHPLLGW